MKMKDYDIVWSLGKPKEINRNRINRNINGKYVVASAHTEEQIQHNEQSLRYVEVSDEFYYPEEFRAQSKSNKQVGEGLINPSYQDPARLIYKTTIRNSYNAYQDLLAYGVCREQARLLLPPAIYTTWVNTLSLQSVMHFVSQRLASGAQKEIRSYAICLVDILEELYPVAWDAWKTHILPTYEK
jgi:thymidylate synthase (FAD)